VQQRTTATWQACVTLLFIAHPAAAKNIQVDADLTEAPRGLIRGKLTIPVEPGPLTLVYPQWLPGNHSPRGPIADVTGLKFSAGGQPVPWRRDLTNMYAVQLEIPAGATSLEVSLESVASNSGGPDQDPTTSNQLALLNWNVITMFPKGHDAAKIMVDPSLVLPDGWKFGCSLELADGESGSRAARFRPVSMEMLIDSPIVAGRHFKRFDLSPGEKPPHVMDVAADSETALGINDKRLKAYERMPAEFAAVLGSRPYRRYHFLLALCDRMHTTGLEHHECSANRGPERTLIDDDIFIEFAGLLTHEYFHSWNGKHRRPDGLLSPDYQTPMRDDLLWVYEGLTEYYGNLMAARTGLWSPEEYRENLAAVAATLTAKQGRTWRPLQDTADMASKLYGSGTNWQMRRRGVDFYGEGELIWLDADTLIRQQTGGQKSLDDFCRAFLGSGVGGSLAGAKPSVIPYAEEDVYKALNDVVPHNWKAFFAARLTSLDPEPPLGGMTRGGWIPVYNGKPNQQLAAVEKVDKRIDLRFSLGFVLNKDKREIIDVVPGSPADRAGLGPGMIIVAVNGRKFDEDLLKDALASTPKTKSIELLVENESFFSTKKLAYEGGARYPHLERVESKPDVLDKIIAPRTK
jgi:predicted metalloprotease with PDZ domain